MKPSSPLTPLTRETGSAGLKNPQRPGSLHRWEAAEETLLSSHSAGSGNRFSGIKKLAATRLAAPLKSGWTEKPPPLLAESGNPAQRV